VFSNHSTDTTTAKTRTYLAEVLVLAVVLRWGLVLQ